MAVKSTTKNAAKKPVAKEKAIPKKVVKKPVKKNKSKDVGLKVVILKNRRNFLGGIIAIAIIVLLVMGIYCLCNNSMRRITANDNLEAMMVVARNEFRGNNLPRVRLTTYNLSLGEMIDQEMVELQGNVEGRCDLDRSRIQVTKTMDFTYSLAVWLHCGDNNIKLLDERLERS